MDKKKRDVVQEFEGMVRDIKLQFSEQQRLIEQRIEQQNLLLLEMTDFCKKRGEIESQYAAALDKLVRRQRSHYPHSPLGRTWQALLESTRRMRDGHQTFAGNFGSKMVDYLSVVSNQLPVLLKRYRDFHNGLQMDEVARLRKFRERIDEYRLACNRLSDDRSKAAKCSSKSSTGKVSSSIFGSLIDSQAALTGAGASKKERELAKLLSTVESSAQKATVARNEYLLGVAGENVALDRMLNSDFTYASFFVDWFFRKILARVFRLSLVGETYSASAKRCEDFLRQSVEELDTTCDLMFPNINPNVDFVNVNFSAMAEEWNVNRLVDQMSNAPGDYRVIIEQHQGAFIPRTLVFEPGRDDNERSVRADSQDAGATLVKARAGCRDGLREAHARIAQIVNEIRRLKNDLIIKLAEPLEENSSNLSMSPNAVESVDNLDSPTPTQIWPFQSQTVSKHANETFVLADVLFAKHCEYLTNERQYEIVRIKLNCIDPALQQFHSTASPAVRASPSSSTPMTITGSRAHREVFGVRLIDYVERTHEPIPAVVRSCVRYLSENALHHPGVFRISGSQPEILELRARFNAGEDPLDGGNSAIADVNNVASLLKLYFRELPDNLVPPSVAQNLVDLRCTFQSDEARLRAELRVALKRSLPPANYAVLRYLLEFLNSVTFYDENMMDAHNLAVCFGPTVTQPICEADRDAVTALEESAEIVSKQRGINDLIADLIINCTEVFERELPDADCDGRRNDRDLSLQQVGGNVAPGKVGELVGEAERDDRARHNSQHSADSASLADLVDSSHATGASQQRLAALPTNNDSMSGSLSADETTSLDNKNVAVELDVVFKPAFDTPTRKPSGDLIATPTVPNVPEPLDKSGAVPLQQPSGIASALKRADSPATFDQSLPSAHTAGINIALATAAEEKAPPPPLPLSPGQSASEDLEPAKRLPPPVARKPVIVKK